MSTKWRGLKVAGVVSVLFALPAYGAATLKGQLERNRIGGAPVAGAAVAAEGASPTTSTSLGAFTLEFPNKRPGDRVKLTVSLPGMTVVNWVQLDVVLPADPGGMNVLTLLLAREADREEMAAEFFRLRSASGIERQYQQRLRRRGRTRRGCCRSWSRPRHWRVRRRRSWRCNPDVIALVRRGDAVGCRGRVDEALQTLDEAAAGQGAGGKKRKEAAGSSLVRLRGTGGSGDRCWRRSFDSRKPRRLIGVRSRQRPTILTDGLISEFSCRN
jgi:hypothetical protein